MTDCSDSPSVCKHYYHTRFHFVVNLIAVLLGFVFDTFIISSQLVFVVATIVFGHVFGPIVFDVFCLVSFRTLKSSISEFGIIWL